MSSTAWLALLVFAASFVIALGMSGMSLGHLPWYLSRASGMAAFVLLSTSVSFGLLISTKMADGFLRRPLVFEVHQFIITAQEAAR